MKMNLLSLLRMAVVIGLLFLAIISCSRSATGGNITGFVLIPDELDLAAAPQEARIYIYLKEIGRASCRERV